MLFLLELRTFSIASTIIFSLPITWFYLYIVLFVIWDYSNIRAHGSSTFICSILWAIVNTGKKCSAIVLIKIKWMAHKNHEKRFYWLALCQSFNSIEIQVFGKLTRQDSIRRRKKSLQSFRFVCSIRWCCQCCLYHRICEWARLIVCLSIFGSKRKFYLSFGWCVCVCVSALVLIT